MTKNKTEDRINPINNTIERGGGGGGREGTVGVEELKVHLLERRTEPQVYIQEKPSRSTKI